MKPQEMTPDEKAQRYEELEAKMRETVEAEARRIEESEDCGAAQRLLSKSMSSWAAEKYGRAMEACFERDSAYKAAGFATPKDAANLIVREFGCVWINWKAAQIRGEQPLSATEMDKLLLLRKKMERLFYITHGEFADYELDDVRYAVNNCKGQ